jgi:outer membrane protein TolC
MIKSSINSALKASIFLSIFLLAILISQGSMALTYDEYIQQVKSDNLSYSASQESIRSFELLKKKAKLVSAVKVYATSERGFIEQNQALAIFSYNRIYTQNNRFGLSYDSEIGLKTNLYYTLNNSQYKNLNTSRFPNPSLANSSTQAIPTIELSLPLWQNGFGRSTRAQRDSLYYNNQAQKLNAKALAISELIDAEKTYWFLVYARKALEIQKRALESAKKIYDYVYKKERMNLGEKSDVLQAKALVESRELFFKQAQNNEIIASRNFNQKRYINSEIVEEKLEDFDIKKLEKIVFSSVKPQDRIDVKAKKALMKSMIANSKIEEENNKPSLNVYGSYSMTQIERSRDLALQNSFDSKGRAGKIGVEFSMPLNIGLSSDIRLGARKAISSEKINYRSELANQDLHWQNLVQNLHNYQENLKLALAIESAQKAKLENERKLLKQGRTSTYQILVFEQDYSNAELNAQEMAYKFHQFLADKKLYEENL